MHSRFGPATGGGIACRAQPAAPTQEAVTNKAIPAQRPAVVLCSHYTQLRALLAIAIIMSVHQCDGSRFASEANS